MSGRRYLVSGRVQGVGFRWFVNQRAAELGLRGYVRNLPDGQVEVVACGSESGLVQLEDDLQHGPSYAEVGRVDKYDIPVDEQQFISFTVK